MKQNLFTKITYALIAFTLVFGGFFAPPASSTVEGPLSIMGSEVAYAASPGLDENGEVPANNGVLDWLGITTGIKEAFGWVFSSIFGMFLALQIGIVSLAGQAFDSAIFYTIVDMGNLLQDADGNMIPGILVGWTVLRDVSNIIFIFTLVFIGIATILGLQTYGWRSLMVRLIIAALLINFSMLITKVVIDTSNLIGSEVYTILKTDDPEGSTSAIILNQSWAVSIFDQVSAFGIGGDGTPAQSPTDSHWQLAWKSLLMIILLAVMTFVFFAAVFMLVARFVILLFLMIVSPIAFASMILPQTRGISQKWWSTLFNQSFFAPAYLLMLWIALMLMDGIGGELAVRDVTFAAMSADPSPDNIQILLYFTMIAALMIAALIIASRMGAYGANTALAMGQRWSRNTGNFIARSTGRAAGGVVGGAVGATAWTGRRTVGATGSNIANSKKLKDWEAKGGFRGSIARGLRSGGTGLSKSSFDARQVGGVGKNLGIGEGKKGGIVKSREDRSKAEQERAKDLAKESYTTDERTLVQKINSDRDELQHNIALQQQALTEIVGRYGAKSPEAQLQREDLGKMQSNLKNMETNLKEVNDAKESRGTARKREYASTLDKKSQTFTRKWITGSAPALSEAATEIRKSKSDLAQLQEYIKKANKEIADADKKDKSSSTSDSTGGASGSTGSAGGTTTP